MKKIAVITGASSGMGRRFAKLWIPLTASMRYGSLPAMKRRWRSCGDRVPYPIRALALDLTDRRSFQTYADALAEEPVEVGCGQRQRLPASSGRGGHAAGGKPEHDGPELSGRGGHCAS